MPQPLLEALRATPGRHDPADANSPVGFGEALEALPHDRVRAQASPDVRREAPDDLLGVFLVVEDVPDPLQPRPRHAAGGDETTHALAIHLGEPAGGPARGGALRGAIGVDRVQGAVDPAV